MFFIGTISHWCFQKRLRESGWGGGKDTRSLTVFPDCLNLWPNLTHHLCRKAKPHQPHIDTPIPLHSACSDCGSAGTQLLVYNSSNKNWLTDQVLDCNFREDGTHSQGPNQCPRPRRSSVRELEMLANLCCRYVEEEKEGDTNRNRTFIRTYSI